MSVRVHVTFDGFKRADVDRKGARKAMRQVGSLVSKGAKRLVAKRGGGMGGYPGKVTGKLQRSISHRVSRVGLMVKIEHYKWNGGDFYPAFLLFGVTGNARRRDHSTQVKNGKWRIAPRQNYFEVSMNAQTAKINQIIERGFKDSIRLY